MRTTFLALHTLLLMASLAGCAAIRPQPPAPAPAGHLTTEPAPAADGIPDLVQQTPYLPVPGAAPAEERYTVVVNDVPVRELLFALARDAKLNIDIGGDISGNVTLNAIDQTLPQILERVARQVTLRYELTKDTIVIAPDSPFLRTYDVGYVNLSRDVDTTVRVATRVATTGDTSVQNSGSGGGRGGAGGGNDNNSSTTELQSRSYNRFWDTLRSNVLSILGEPNTLGAEQQASDKVIVNAETGLLTVRATSRQHEMIEQFIDRVLVNARRQVMIEATIVEVSLSDQYQAGVDWNFILRAGGTGFTVNQGLLGRVADGALENTISSLTLGYTDPQVGDNSVTSTVRLLHEFGDTRVLSSPRLMVLNNQTAMLKVVEELVYFTVNVTNLDGTTTAQGRTLVDTDVRSVPVGLVMAVTPQISANNEVTLTVRPTISQKIDDAVDPGPALISRLNQGDNEVTNLVPVIRVREMESVLKLVDGQIGVLGGLMQDDIRGGNRDIPGLARVPVLGPMLFRTEEANKRKTELVVFLRPVVVRDPSINTDLKDYSDLLGQAPGPAPVPGTGAQVP
ncbi:MAG: secretin N-terminal domain-containing protein [Gammaproteobacteria bacterium]|nr:secretin N-terminal domain-containing protein [Gammaproteobacteria bacterium]